MTNGRKAIDCPETTEGHQWLETDLGFECIACWFRLRSRVVRQGSQRIQSTEADKAFNRAWYKHTR